MGRHLGQNVGQRNTSTVYRLSGPAAELSRVGYSTICDGENKLLSFQCYSRFCGRRLGLHTSGWILQYWHLSLLKAGSLKHGCCRWNFVASLFTSWDIVTSGFVAAILDSHFRLSRVAFSIVSLYWWIQNIWVLLLMFQRYLALFHAYNLNYEHFRCWRHYLFSIAGFTFQTLRIQCEIILCNKRLKIRVDCSTLSKVISNSRCGYFHPLPPHRNGMCSKNHWDDEG